MSALLPERERASIASRFFSIKHAQGLLPRWAKAKKHASIASRTFLSNMHKASSHREVPGGNARDMHQAKHGVQVTYAETGQHRFHQVSVKCHKVASHFEPKQRRHTHTAKHNVQQVRYGQSHANIANGTSVSMSQSATPATQIARQCHQVPRLRRKVADIANGTSVSRSATPATEMKCQCHEVPRATKGDVTGRCLQVLRLPRETKVDVTKCHACHANEMSMSQSATPGTQMARQCHQVPRLARKWHVNVTKCHACHAKSQTLQMERQCREVPRLPRK